MWKTREVVGEYEVRASNCAVRWETDGPEKYGSYDDKEGQRRNEEAAGRQGGEVVIIDWKPGFLLPRILGGRCSRCTRSSSGGGQVGSVVAPITHVFP